MIQAIKQKFQGSVLVFTLLALSVLLLGALSLATATLVGQKTAKDTDHSMQAFQTSDSGAELVLKGLKDADSGDTLTVATSAVGSGCASSAVTGEVRSGDSYTVEFFDDDTDTQLDCSASVSDVDRIKSTGRYAGTARAIETVVASSEGEYQLDCSDDSSACCMMDDSNEVKCSMNRYTVLTVNLAVDGWYPMAAGPAFASASGAYSLALFNAYDDGMAVCRIDKENGDIECVAAHDDNTSAGGVDAVWYDFPYSYHGYNTPVFE